MNLVIVESPAKAKTINKYLGKEYKVLASYGHVRDLPSKNGSVDPENNFKMEWELDTFSKKYVKEIEDALDIEVLQKKIAGFYQVGAVMSATSNGGIIHPLTDEDDVNAFSNILGVDVEPATINGGVPFVSSGILANDNAVVVGTLTNGPEIMMLTRAFIN